MTKKEFILELRKSLSGLPSKEREEGISFYSEMIDDRIEDGCSEEEAVSAVGSIEQISSQIIRETPLISIAKERIKPKRPLRIWEIVLLVVGAPLWIPLLAAVGIIILSVYVVIYSVIISLWAVFISVLVCFPCGIIVGIINACFGNGLLGFSLIGVGLACGGLAIFLFIGCKVATKGIFSITQKLILAIKRCFVKKENNNE